MEDSIMGLKEQGQDSWNIAYERGGNICFYPHEEIIRFTNKYVRKRKSVNEFENIMPIKDDDWKSFASLDLGCGIGRHVKFLDEFGLNPYGIDLSDEAITMGKEWFSSIGKSKLAERLIVGSVMELPFENNFFEMCVSHGVLDSMPREVAIKGIEETHRVLKPSALMYVDMIMDTSRGDQDETVDSGYEKDTVQSYFTAESIKLLLEKYFEILEFKIIYWTDENGNEKNKRAHLIIQNR